MCSRLQLGYVFCSWLPLQNHKCPALEIWEFVHTKKTNKSYTICHTFEIIWAPHIALGAPSIKSMCAAHTVSARGDLFHPVILAPKDPNGLACKSYTLSTRLKKNPVNTIEYKASSTQTKIQLETFISHSTLFFEPASCSKISGCDTP